MIINFSGIIITIVKIDCAANKEKKTLMMSIKRWASSGDDIIVVLYSLPNTGVSLSELHPKIYFKNGT